MAVLRRHLDRRTFVLAHSELERLFGAIVTDSDLPLPQAQTQLGRERVDYFWPELGLVVEVDGLRYHRTAAQQAKDRERDHIHLAAGRTALRFTYEEVKYRPGYVRATLIRVARRLSAVGSRPAR
ncbi:MAG: DUF559 domain-containing protein [Thermoleophilaceae bacterium]|nr:DUF559 domain-containing protein [Thermoleophilaceae bacterium]